MVDFSLVIVGIQGMEFVQFCFLIRMRSPFFPDFSLVLQSTSTRR
jgi:hypothetical protein